MYVFINGTSRREKEKGREVQSVFSVGREALRLPIAFGWKCVSAWWWAVVLERHLVLLHDGADGTVYFRCDVL